MVDEGEERVCPILHVADADRSVDWYRRLGFKRQWLHRFEPTFPAYVSVARSPLVELHLSEHRGDARPDTLVFLNVSDLGPIAQEFGVEPRFGPWGGRTIELQDLDGNRLRIGEPADNRVARPATYDHASDEEHDE